MRPADRADFKSACKIRVIACVNEKYYPAWPYRLVRRIRPSSQTSGLGPSCRRCPWVATLALLQAKKAPACVRVGNKRNVISILTCICRRCFQAGIAPNRWRRVLAQRSAARWCGSELPNPAVTPLKYLEPTRAVRQKAAL
jgi:hypothetical protein